jgi:hypothetical protein
VPRLKPINNAEIIFAKFDKILTISLCLEDTRVRFKYFIIKMWLKYICYIRNSWECEIFQDVHVKLNPGLSWQKQHSTRRRLLLPAKWT